MHQTNPLFERAPMLRHRYAAPVLFAVCFGVFFWRAIFLGEVFCGDDLVNMFIPYLTAIGDTLRDHGQLSFWNPYFYCGFPLVAEIQVGYFYPPNWLHLLLSPARTYTTLTLLHLAMGGWGFSRLARMAGLSREAALLGALSFVFGAYVTGRHDAGNNVLIYTTMWAPLVLGRMHRCYRQPSAARALWLAFAVGGSLLSGTPQIAFYTFLGAGAMLLHHFIAAAWRPPTAREEAAPRRSSVRSLALIGAGAALGLLLAMVQILPTQEWAALTQDRAGAHRLSLLAQGSLEPRMLWTFIFPHFFADPASSTKYWGALGYREYALYGGILSLLLPALALTFRLSGRFAKTAEEMTPAHPLLKWLPWAFVLALLLALGAHTPLYRFCFAHLPGFNLFRYPARLLLLCHLALALLLAASWDDLRPQLARAGATRIAIGFAVAVIAGGAILLFCMPSILGAIPFAEKHLGGVAALSDPRSPHYQVTQIARQAVIRAILLGGLGLLPLVLATRRRLSPARTYYAIAILLFADLAGFGGPFVKTLPASALADEFYPASAAIRQLQSLKAEGGEPARFMCLDSVSYYWLEDKNRELLDNRAALHGLRRARGFNPLYPRYLAQLTNALGGSPIHAYATGKMSVLKLARPRLLRYFAVDALFFNPDEFHRASPGDRRFETGLHAQNPPGSREHAVLRRGVGGAKDDEQEILFLRDPNRIDERSCLIAGLSAAKGDPPTPAGAELGAVKLARWTPDERVYQARVGDLAWFVLSESYHPGWRVFVDGQAVRVWRANHAFMAARLPQGDHEVVWRFAPRSVRVGGALSALGLLLAAGLGIYTRRRSQE